MNAPCAEAGCPYTADDQCAHMGCPQRFTRRADTPASKISKITSLEELQGYESAAKARGILPDELRAIHEKRASLTPKKRGRK